MQSPFEELDSLLKEDFVLREALIERGELFGGYHPEMQALHISNGKKFMSLIERFGWPDPKKDGDTAVDNAWYIVMHAISLPSLQRSVLRILQSNSTASSPAQLGMLEDRILVFSGKKQRFGTQVDWDRNGILNPYPIEDEEHVDIRRSQAKLPPLQNALALFRERAVREDEKPPANMTEYCERRENWMVRAGWIKDKSEIDPAYFSYWGIT